MRDDCHAARHSWCLHAIVCLGKSTWSHGYTWRGRWPLGQGRSVGLGPGQSGQASAGTAARSSTRTGISPRRDKLLNRRELHGPPRLCLNGARATAAGRLVFATQFLLEASLDPRCMSRARLRPHSPPNGPWLPQPTPPHGGCPRTGCGDAFAPAGRASRLGAPMTRCTKGFLPVPCRMAGCPRATVGRRGSPPSGRVQVDPAWLTSVRRVHRAWTVPSSGERRPNGERCCAVRAWP